MAIAGRKSVFQTNKAAETSTFDFGGSAGRASRKDEWGRLNSSKKESSWENCVDLLSEYGSCSKAIEVDEGYSKGVWYAIDVVQDDQVNILCQLQVEDLNVRALRQQSLDRKFHIASCSAISRLASGRETRSSSLSRSECSIATPSLIYIQERSAVKISDYDQI
jgi:hypothetical protein